MKRLFLIVFGILMLASCAKRGSIQGGAKDSIAPVLTMSFPKNFSTNFKGNTIKLNFDEFIKLKNLNKQLIVSPPFEKMPDISPTSVTKDLTIKIKDILLPNTTYSFNFGESIEDNNEGNPLRQFKYVFSTGTYIDSLKLSGKIKDALEKKTDNFVSIQLYDVNSKYSDSIIYKSKPRYVTNTLDSLTTFTFENLKAGKYLLVALKDKNNNFKFDPKTDKIGFQKQFITIPNDTIFGLELFKEKQPFKALKPKQNKGNSFILAYEGLLEKPTIVVKNGSEIVPNLVTKIEKKDSLQVWFKAEKLDSVSVNVKQNKFDENFVLKLKKQKSDTLKFTPIRTDLPLRERFSLNSTIPIVDIDESKIVVLNKDSVAVKFKIVNDTYKQELKFDFVPEANQKYKIKVFPGAFVDFYEAKNDTLLYKLATKSLADYGNLRLKLEKIKTYPVVVQLTDNNGKISYEDTLVSGSSLNFDLIEPAKYTLRVFYDENKNGIWDSGDFMLKKQSEEVIYYPKEIDVRANWDIEQVFDLSVK